MRCRLPGGATMDRRRTDLAPLPNFAARPISSGDSNLTSSSSSSSSGSDILRQVRAAFFKRHRPLGTFSGDMQSSFSRARRVLVPQAEQSKSCGGNPASSFPSSNAGKKLIWENSARGNERILKSEFGKNKDDNAVWVTNPAEDSLFTSSMSGTITNICGGTVTALGVQKRDAELKIHEKSSDFNEVPKDDHSSPNRGFGGAQLTTEIRTHQISSHFGSLALTEGPMTEVTSVRSFGPMENDVGQMEMCKNTNEFVESVSERNNEARNNQKLLAQPDQAAVADSLLGTSTSAHSVPTVQSNVSSLAGQGTLQTQVSSSTLQNFSSIPDHAQIEGQYTSHDGVMKGKDDACDAKDCNKNIRPSQLCRAEKTSRKKKYDPNVFFRVNGKLYQKLGKIGSGGSSEVHKVISSDCTIYALKMIRLKGRDYPTAYGFCQEIEYLKKLKGKSHIIQLIDYEVTDKTLLKQIVNGSMAMKDGRINEDEFIYMVLEYGEIDLAHMLSQKWREMDNSSNEIDENWLRFYWQQMLEAVHTIHEERIVHSDLKPANFLLVKGSLKLIDFGIAKAILNDTTNIQRDAQVGTLNYMSPEAFMWNEEDALGSTIKCGRPSDIWSLGCILYQMVYGKTPFAEYKTFWAKFKAICDKRHEIVYEPVSNSWLVDLMRRCLAWDRDQRWRIPQLLQHPFLAPSLPLTNPGCGHVALLVRGVAAFSECPEVARLCSELYEVVQRLERERAQAQTQTQT